ncbi:CRISPR-associated helicase Cas3' [Limisphaera ngatamarikiensis]|uniref:CRISPR-associated helicase Cas3 n=1 Tax=Limisphaera ngatamarikiensis TaxID=1324935 RepID=A0A6M1RM66_9BACT|nr:CRISPR-associated helicase Cas3' [Limisphaera ngatamarikiensis]
MGKTAAVVLAWLWNRLYTLPHPPSPNGSSKPQPNHVAHKPWPRRLVYCLPMRTLVEQTAENIQRWLANLWEKRDALALSDSALAELHWMAGDRSPDHPAHSPLILMGGQQLESHLRDWDLYPEKPCIVIGTQDMLLSRALNRGYGMSRYRWPIHFALLNNDCLWVVDETQLMGVGLETTAQLDAFRQFLGNGRPGTVGPAATWWLSATLDADRLNTVDHTPPNGGWPNLILDDRDLALESVRARVHAPKKLVRAEIDLSDSTLPNYANLVADLVLERHVQGSLTLVILNRVNRAQEVYSRLKAMAPHADLALVHSRFRPPDRRKHEEVLKQPGSRIVIATQAVEAGIDISAQTLITELAPWSSMVQRFGRCNRYGEFGSGEASIIWIDIAPRSENSDLCQPYTCAELHDARERLKNLQDASPIHLQRIDPPVTSDIRPVLRRKDILELFDTTPDLAGHDLDISRFIRDHEGTDVQVFWRALNGQEPSQNQPEPAPGELCQVSLASFQAFLRSLTKRSGTHQLWPVWIWNPLAEQWEEARVPQHPRPGATYLVNVDAGGYSSELGWFGTADHAPHIPLITPSDNLSTQCADLGQGYSGDPSSLRGVWVTLTEHTRHVCTETHNLVSSLAPELTQLDLREPPANILVTAARWHDLGKAHEVFQHMLRGDDSSRAQQLWAKAKAPARPASRRYFRHELASALAWLLTQPESHPERDLVAYLIASHHGKVRLSLRSMPGEEPPPDRPDARIARGIVEGDLLPPEAFAAIEVTPPAEPLRLTLDLMEMGRNSSGHPSWLERMLALRDRLGPFRLAWLETLLRAADARASAAESRQNANTQTSNTSNPQI